MNIFRDPILLVLAIVAIACALFVNPYYLYLLTMAALTVIVGVGLTYLYERLPTIVFLLSAGFFGGIAMAIYCPLTLLINLRFLPAAARPGPIRVTILALVSLFYAAFAVAAVWNVVAIARAGGFSDW